MTRIRIFPYNAGSRSARALAERVGGRVLRLNGSRFIPRGNDLIVNWGNRTIPYNPNIRVLNRTGFNLSDKLVFFNHFRDINGVNLPRFWTRQQDIPDDAFPIVCRTLLNGHSGRGIVIADRRSELVNAPLYVEYVKKESEFRIHMGKDRQGRSIIIDQQKKVRAADNTNPDFRIRNHANGFNFQRHNINVPEQVLEQARAVIENTTLDFGAIDIIYNARRRTAYVLEINLAPGLEGTTVENYGNYINSRV